jgi:ADP-ribose pyrophosphatase
VKKSSSGSSRCPDRVASTLAYRGLFFRVWRDRVRLPGGLVAPVDRIDHPDAVAVVPVGEDGRVILLSQYRPVLMRWLLEIPAGKLAPGEDPRAGAARELEEEAGVRAHRLDLLVAFHPAPGTMTEWMRVYRATGLARVPRGERARADADEVIRIRRYRPDEIARLVRSGRIRDAKTLVGLAAAGLWRAGRPGEAGPAAGAASGRGRRDGRSLRSRSGSVRPPARAPARRSRRARRGASGARRR